MKKQNHGDNDEYIKDLEEWMDHQYDPGYWTGGNIPPHIKYLKRPPRLLLELLGDRFDFLDRFFGLVNG